MEKIVVTDAGKQISQLKMGFTILPNPVGNKEGFIVRILGEATPPDRPAFQVIGYLGGSEQSRELPTFQSAVATVFATIEEAEKAIQDQEASVTQRWHELIFNTENTDD